MAHWLLAETEHCYQLYLLYKVCVHCTSNSDYIDLEYILPAVIEGIWLSQEKLGRPQYTRYISDVVELICRNSAASLS